MRLVSLLLVVSALAAGSAAAATDPYLEKTLKADMVKTFKKQSPTMKITTVKCVLPENGATAHCKASFTISGIKGYYPVTAKLHEVGAKLTWSAQSPRCLDPKTKKYAAC